MPFSETYTGNEPLWYKDAVIYELPIKSFFDSNDDGIGDIRGLIEKLDYLEGLGVSAIWLLPFYPSPLKDDGYDISDYFNVNPDYGTLRNFRKLLKEAHKRSIKIIIELVINHTSDQHPWFKRARRLKSGSVFRNFYVWNDTPDKYKETRIIFQDFETSNWSWDPEAKAYYWHRFYSHQPDLNYDNPRVIKEIKRIMDYWFSMGVDGMRLDAVPYLIEREGTNCENLPETHSILKELRAHVDRKFKDRMLIAEANQWPEDAAEYLGTGDECHMAFHFPVMPRLFMALRMEDRFPIIDILEQTPQIPDKCQWAMFLRNHDELTLEMVTDEERDYMYRVYADDPRSRLNLGIRRRLAPLLDNDRKKIELMNIILFSLPGTPIIYYGDEIGMGDNYYLGDRDGVRTPMQWSSDRNAGFSRTNPQKLYLPVIFDPEYHFEALNVENQEINTSSLLWWMKHVIAMRKYYPAFSRGELRFLFPENSKVLAFIRQYKDEKILVVINLSRVTQFVDLELSEYAGSVPRELFSQNQFPPIGEKPYFITLGSYGHYWFLIEEAEKSIQEEKHIPDIIINEKWSALFGKKAKRKLEKEVLPQYLMGRRWFGGKARNIRKVTINERIPVSSDNEYFYVIFLQIDYTTGSSDWYSLPVSFLPVEDAKILMQEYPQSVITRLFTADQEGILYDAIYNEEFRKRIFRLFLKRYKLKGLDGELTASQGQKIKQWKKTNSSQLTGKVIQSEQSNSSILYGDSFFLKYYRRIERGKNPEPEIVKYLTEKTDFLNVPAYAGSLEYRSGKSESTVIGLLQEFVHNEGDAWSITLDAVDQYFDRVLSRKKDIQEPDIRSLSIVDVDITQTPEFIQELVDTAFLERARLLGMRTGEMHISLSGLTENPDFAPEPFSKLYQRSLYQALRSRAVLGLENLRKCSKNLPEHIRVEVEEILKSRQKIQNRFKKLMEGKITGLKIRIHGDYHLGQVLFTGKDFVIIDFEGEPMKPLSERRLKYSCFRDVAGMIRSFHYAVYNKLFQRAAISPKEFQLLQHWIQPWYRYISGVFLQAYLETVADAPLIPGKKEQTEILLDVFLLDKIIYEIGYELNNRPDWVIIPINGIKSILKEQSSDRKK